MPDPPLAPASVRVRRRVEWMDTDAAGIYHWTTVGRFFESAEAALFRALSLPQSTLALTPRVSVHLEFRSSLRFGDEVWVELTVAVVGRTSLRYALAVTDLHDRPVAEGEIVCCLLDPDRGAPQPWPDGIRHALQTGGRVTGS
jgi:YbgC/YbaW family acyl-CoA thioester hydrolase